MTDLTIGSGPRRPVQLQKVKTTGWTKARRETFLDHLAATCNVRLSTAAAGMQTSSAYALRRRDPEFAALWRAALLTGYDRLEEMLLQMALQPVNAVEAGDPEDIDMGAFDARLAIDLLGKHRAAAEGRTRGRGGAHRRASEEEVNAALTKRLDGLARRLRHRA